MKNFLNKSSLIILDRICLTYLSLCAVFILSGCADNGKPDSRVSVLSQKIETVLDVVVGADNVALYHPLLKDKKVALVVNQTSTIGETHIVDSLQKLNVNIGAIFAPEHGFRGEADAGELIKDGKDLNSGAPVISLYGKKKKPSSQDLEGIEVVVFDIQDVGARFYTYISSLHYVMEACAELNIPIVVLDRPNPNAHYIDGPILEEEYKSFIGMHPVPVVYGMTIGEYAQMINGEGWLVNGIKADLTVIKNNNYSHDTYYELPIKPSPNLPNARSVFLYPSLCFFEGTDVSVGRGTDLQFQILGHPDYASGEFQFTPTSRAGAKYPKHENTLCKGKNLSKVTTGSLHKADGLNLSYLLDAYNELTKDGGSFFLEKNNFFEKLAGTADLRKQIQSGKTETEIKNSWNEGLDRFREVRKAYLLYD